MHVVLTFDLEITEYGDSNTMTLNDCTLDRIRTDYVKSFTRPVYG